MQVKTFKFSPRQQLLKNSTVMLVSMPLQFPAEANFYDHSLQLLTRQAREETRRT